MGRNDSKVTKGKYHINTMEILKLFPVNKYLYVCNKGSSLDNCCYICKSRPFWIFGLFSFFSFFQSKSWGVCIEKEREKKHELLR